MREAIHDVDDPRLAPYRATREGSQLKARGLLIAEGRRAIRVLLDSDFAVQSLLMTPSAEAELAPPDDIPRYVVERPVLRELLKFKLHQGALAVAERGPPRDWRTLGDRLVVLDAVSDPDNVGTTFRNAAAFGIDGVLLGPGCADPLYRKAIRTSCGTTLTLPFAAVDDLPAVLTKMDRQVLALVPDGTRTLTQVPIARRAALILGNEGDGVSSAVRAVAEPVRIDMADGADSVNVAAAGAIALHHCFTRRGADPLA